VEVFQSGNARPSRAAKTNVKLLRGKLQILADRVVCEAMQRFKIGDRVELLPRFAHLYPPGKGAVIDVTPDDSRPMFNEYRIQFSDGSISVVFEFQMREAVD
jgi:hypothetical protein